jgi:hypothetical protein
VPKVVKEAQVEIDRLIAALAAGEEPPAADLWTFESFETETEASRPRTEAPVHLIISSRQALTRQYGESGFERLDEDLHHLKRAIEASADLEALIVYVDDEPSLRPLGLSPVDAANPWQVKKLVDGIDAHLAADGREIRYLLIIGGDRIIPFHRLPNPVDDQDPDVPSDNPYACRDTNYLIPERAIGRMPDGESGGFGLLSTLIRTSVAAHRRRSVPKGLLGALTAALKGIGHPGRKGQGLGYSASIWRKASRAVFQIIGDDSRLRTSPPVTYEAFQVVDPPHFSYFNLHGIEDGPNWYGQRDTLFPADYPLFPLALRPQDPGIDDHANAVVFTEACYGANILGKREADSIALRFLGAQALAVVGSTKVSYGSIAPPLLGADLVGKYFWEGLRAHLTVGDALRHAKVTMANEMQKRQGYLDDEDQKALISFVLYGDPALPITAIQRTAPVSVSREAFCPPIICSKGGVARRNRATDDLVASVKARIETSLPHMSHARVRARPLAVCTGGCETNCGLSKPAGGRLPSVSPRQKSLEGDQRGWALVLEKDIPVGSGADEVVPREHHQVVKVVVSESGHILKMAVSK